MLTINGIGRLNKRIELLQHRDTIDEYGLTHQEIVPVFSHKIWARIEPLRGKEYLVAYKDIQASMVKITIRYVKGVTADMLVRYKDTTYEIISVQNPYEGNVKLELMCQHKKVGDGDERDES